jgi:hypothetical protein
LALGFPIRADLSFRFFPVDAIGRAAWRIPASLYVDAVYSPRVFSVSPLTFGFRARYSGFWLSSWAWTVVFMAQRTQLDQGAKDLRELAQSALAEGSIAALRDLRVDQVGNSLLLSGMVTSFYHKQLAQEQVRLAVGEIEIVNSIVVL